MAINFRRVGKAQAAFDFRFHGRARVVLAAGFLSVALVAHAREGSRLPDGWGFTPIELLVVIAIIAIPAAWIGLRSRNRSVEVVK